VKRSPLKPQSAKRRNLMTQRREVVQFVMDRDMYKCQAQLPGVCSFTATDVHELMTRARGGSIVDPENCIALCRSCHTWITDDASGWAQEFGYLIHSWAGPGDIRSAKRARMGWLYGPNEIYHDDDDPEAP